jgi:DNA polymerase elongation subunit (family B)
MPGDRYVAGVYNYRDKCISLKVEGTSAWTDIDFPHYFFVEGKPSAELIDMFRLVEMDGKWCRCYVPAPNAERKDIIRKLEGYGIETYEGDVSPINRFMTDNDIAFGDPRILYFDLETDGSAGWDDLAGHRILVIGYHSSVTGKTGHIVAGRRASGEKACIQEFLRRVGEHDLLVAWNGDAYDEPVLKARAEKHGFGDTWSEHWRGVNFLDMMRLFKKYYARDDKGAGVRVSFALDNIAKTILGRGKEKKPMLTRDGKVNPVQAIVDAWQHKPGELAEYCERDVDIMVELEQKLGFISFHKTLSNLCGRFLSSYTIWAGYLNDAFVLRWGRKNGTRFRTKFTYYDERVDVEQIEGAYVMEPVAGMHDGVCDLDFASLYPNIIRTFNISPEVKAVTKNERNGPLAFNGVRFHPTVIGAFPQIVTETLQLRKKHKERVFALEADGKEGTLEHLKAKQMSDAYKLLGNTMYGIMASPMLRYYDPECGEAVTKSGKAIILHVLSLAAKRGFKVILSDTDSAYLQCSKEDAVEFASEMAGEIDRFVSERGGVPGFIRLDLDVVYERIICVAKKRYTGLKDTGKIDVKGLDFVRSDGCRIMRDMQRRIIDYLLLVERPNARMAVRIISTYRDRIYSRLVELDDIVLAQSLGKSLDEYKAEPPHVRVAKEMLAQGQEVYAGMKIPYVIIGCDFKGKQVVVHADKFEGKYDPEFYWRRKVYPATEEILAVVFKEKSDLELLAQLCPKKERKNRRKA